MNIKNSSSLRAALVTAALAAAGLAQAQTGFQYNDRDLVLGFRQPGSSASDLIVDLGQVSNYFKLTAGATMNITNYTVSTLNGNFTSGLDQLYWSVSGDVHNNTIGDPNYPLYSLWLTRPRTATGTKTAAWTPHSTFQQGPTAGKVSGIGNNAATYGGTVPSSAANSTALIEVPASSAYSYSTLVGAVGNLSGTFQGDIEQVTPFGFASGGVAAQADFYQLIPSASSATYLGYFTLNTDGSMTYTAASATVTIPQPTITSVTRANGVTSVSFTTVSTGTYSLRGIGASGISTARSTWPVIGSPVVGTGSVVTLTDSGANSSEFYVISAVPTP